MPQFRMQAHNMQPNNLHLTLRFMGNVAADQAGCMQRVAQTIRVAAFDVQRDISSTGRPRESYFVISA